MKTPLLFGLGLALLASGQLIAGEARDRRAHWPAAIDEPFAPSPGTAPFATLGYREAAADFFWLRAVGYFGGDDKTLSGLQALVEAIVALDPYFYRAYTWGGSLVGSTRERDDLAANLWAAELLERAMPYFPEKWGPPFYAGQIYYVDLKSDDPAQQRAWLAKGADLLERALHLPDAPQGAYTDVAHIRSKLGQHTRAVTELREMILVAREPRVKDKLLKQLAELAERDYDALRAEVLLEQYKFNRQWHTERPAISEDMYQLLGPRPGATIDLARLATPRDLVGADADLDDDQDDDQDDAPLPPTGAAPTAAPASPAP